MTDEAVPVERALLALIASFAAMLALGPFVGGGLLGLATYQLLGIGVPTLAVASFSPSPRNALALHAPSVHGVIGALLIGCSLWLVLVLAVAPISEKLAVEEEAARLKELVGGPTPLALRLFAAALVPAVCEELLFRGMLVPSMARRYGAPWAILSSALLFGGFHFSLPRLLPTTLLGVVLGWVALRTRSVVPCILLHALNNGFAVAMSEYQAPRIPLWVVGAAAVGCIAGAALVARTPRQ